MTMIGVVKKVRPVGVSYGEYDSSANRMPVYLDGKRVGDIRGILNGWQYQANEGTSSPMYGVLTNLKTYLRETL